MSIKVGERVRTVTKGFYNDKIGNVVEIQNINDENKYIVHIENIDLKLAFSGSELRKY